MERAGTAVLWNVEVAAEVESAVLSRSDPVSQNVLCSRGDTRFYHPEIRNHAELIRRCARVAATTNSTLAPTLAPFILSAVARSGSTGQVRCTEGDAG